MTRLLKRAVAAAAIMASLSGCAAVTSVAGMIPGLGALAPGGGGGGQPAGFAPEDLAANPGEFMLIWVPTLFPEAGLGKVTQDNGRRVTYESQSGYTVAFDDGMLVGTRGLPDDLMGASTAASRAALRKGGGNVVRYHDSLAPLDRIVQTRFDCEIRSAGRETVNLGVREVTARKFTEACRSPRLEFENTYWLDSDGTILSSHQFISPTVAYLRSSRL